jgi:hypothetical protein
MCRKSHWWRVDSATACIAVGIVLVAHPIWKGGASGYKIVTGFDVRIKRTDISRIVLDSGGRTFSSASVSGITLQDLVCLSTFP